MQKAETFWTTFGKGRGLRF